MTPRDDLDEVRALWDTEAATFDEAPDHGLRDDRVREVWRTLLLGVLPPAPARIADLGCGTGTLSLLLADAGFTVDGVDLSRSEEHTSELQSQSNLVCRLLLEKKKK